MRQIAVLTAALLCSATFAWAQRTKPAFKPESTAIVFVNSSSAPAVEYKYHDGTALLADGSFLKGRFQYNGRKVFTYRANGHAERQRLGLSMVKRMVLAGADTSVTNRADSTVFIQLGHRLYRQLAGGSVLVLDRRFAVDEEKGKMGRKLYILDDNGEVYGFRSLPKLNKWFYTFRERSGKQLPDVYLNESEIVKAVARLNDE